MKLTRIMSTVRKPFGNRKFYELPEDYFLKAAKIQTIPSAEKEETAKLLSYIDDNVVGKHATFAGPYGRRKVVYCDYTASARSLRFIEEYILNEVLPFYGNTHTTTTITSLQSTLYRHEARDIVRNAVHASENDMVVFTAHGCTGAVHKLIHALDLKVPPVVFVGPCEHHSNLLPWRELGSRIIRISETKEGILDLNHLESQLQVHQNLPDNPPLIGCFSAASNITGILADDVATTLLLHQYGALAFWDFATAAPYVPLDMNPIIPGIKEKAAYKDAMFFSGHKFVGGVQTPGILIAKKSLFKNPVPQGCGGGSVFFVSRNGHSYLQDPETREEGGTPAIIESIRAGLVFQLKQTIGSVTIMAREEEIIKMVLSHIRTIPEIILLGSNSQAMKRLAVFSFMVRHPRGTFLHHNFVCAVLNDMFGIQARGGCACAGPYAQDLMGIDEELANRYEAVLLEDSRLDRHHLRRKEEHSNYEMLRPGFTRLSLPFFMPESEVAFVLEALKMVATEGWKLLPQYLLKPETGEWKHHSNQVYRERKWLGTVNYAGAKMTFNERRISGVTPCPKDYAECLHTARNTFNKARKMAQRYPLADQCVMFDGELNNLRWFMLPSEAQDLLLGHSQNVKQDVPFQPVIYNGSRVIPAQVARHNSLSALDVRNVSKSSEHIVRQRSDSKSPARSTFSNLLIPHSRERCYSLGSPLVPDPPSPLTGHNRKRQISCGSQTDITDSDMSHGDLDLRNLTPTIAANNATENLHAYVQGVTKELATEIKSELREVIAQVEDVLSDAGTDAEHNISMEKRNSFESLKRREQVLPVSPLSNSNDQINFPSNPSTPVHCNQLVVQPDTITADLFSEYLAELTTEVVSEMKSEFREMVSAVDELISPSGESAGGRTWSPVSDTNGCACELSQPMIENKSDNESLHPEIQDDPQHLETRQDLSHCDNVERRTELNSSPQTLYPEQPDDLKCKKNCFLSNNDRNNIITADRNLKKMQPHWCCPPKNIWKPTHEAIHEFDMIRNGDRVIVCLSGGKDSLSLLHTLHQYQHYAAAKSIYFDIGAATVDPHSSAYDPRPLIPYLSELGVEYFYEEQSILEQASKTGCKSVCSFCSRMKRGRLYATARQNKYNVLALGQHLDDLAESFLMSVFHNGRLRSMKAHYYVREQDLRVIRPFVYVRERSLRQFAESRHLPIIPENCPACFQAPKERHRMKQLLAQQEILFPRLFLSLRTAIKPLISFRHTGQESTVFGGEATNISKSILSSDDES